MRRGVTPYRLVRRTLTAAGVMLGTLIGALPAALPLLFGIAGPAGAQEIRMPILLPAAPWRASGRYELYGDNLFKLVDRGLFFYIGEPGATAHYVHVDNLVDALL